MGEVIEVTSVTDMEIESCVKVLHFVVGDGSRWLDSRFKKLRKAIHLVSEIHREISFGGKSPEEHKEKVDRKKEAGMRKARDRAYDLLMINKRKLRMERLNRLNALLEDNGGDVPLIPDGAVETDSIAKDGGGIELILDKEEDDKGCERTDDSADVESSKEKAEMLRRPRSCYTCKTRFRSLHHFYDQLCPACATLNWTKRMQEANMKEMNILLTGGRVKIGFQCGLKLLRCGANLIVTTRFPKDATRRYLEQKDASEWCDRLKIIGLDLRDIGRLEMFCDKLTESLSHLDAIINNACQTVRRPPSYYAHLLPLERKSIKALPAAHQAVLAADVELSAQRLKLANASSGSEEGVPNSRTAGKTAVVDVLTTTALNSLSSAGQSQIVVMDEDKDGAKFCPRGKTDVNGQQIDLRRVNSWKLRLGEVKTPEVAEVFAINSLAPFIINSRLQSLMLNHVGTRDGSYVINVSAMEGKFYRFKTAAHPHTNMAKAALNMMTRTCAADLALKKIYMNSVDTGWINDENPLRTANRIAKENNFQTPIDEIDAAARILDPIMIGINERRFIFGKFLKDYKESEW
eukprot:g5436.t1